jgi:subtilase family serine protease
MRLSLKTFLGLGLGTALAGLPIAGAMAALPQITGAIDDRATLALTGDVSTLVTRSHDLGEIDGATALPHIRLELKRPASVQAAFDALVRAQWTKGSPSYHKWLQPADLRAYGPAQADIDAITSWLAAHKLTVSAVSRDGMMIDFGGRARDVSAAFHTSLHHLSLNGETHIANIGAPAIPAAIAPAVTGLTLHNFFPKPMTRHITPGYTSTGKFGTFYGVAPADFATIYHLNPLLSGTNQFGRPITGAGVTVAVVEQTKIRAGDWTNFRSQFGLSGYDGTLSQIHPGGCTDPGFTGDEVEAAIDAEWSSAAAPGAVILEASCASLPPLNFGVEQSLENLVTVGTPATIFSISYGGAEIFNGYAFTQGWTNLVEEGASEGKSIFVSSGDSGSSADRFPVTPDTDGLGVNALSDSQYVVSVGGTDFLDTYLGEDAKYWSATNSPVGQSALSYIPETPWNNSCASTLIAKFNGFASPLAACNSTTSFPQQDGVGGTGGQSLFATKPDWQLLTVPGVPNDNSRDQPDISLFAANGIWGHFYIICMSDKSEGGSPCKYTNQGDLLGNAYGGTSVSAPALAGITALIQQTLTLSQLGTSIGNPNPYFYGIAKAQYTNPNGLTQCDSTLGTKSSVACAFHVITVGNNDQPCVPGTANCYAGAGDTVGILEQPRVQKGPAFTADQGYSLATGLGSVDGTNLLYNFVNIYP